jgi:hypothetical protein
MLKFLKKFWSDEVIEFYCHPSLQGVIPEPKPAVKSFPEWYKTLAPEDFSSRDIFNAPIMTAKKCLPIIDAMSLGFTMPLCADLQVTTNETLSEIKLHNPPNLKVAEFHDLKQVGGRSYPGYPGQPVKFINHWVIKTKPGWSTLFITPINYFNQDFTCIGGMVDTDRYPKEVNFPAVWHTPNFDDVIPAGTPLVTAIPIKRKAFSKKVKIRDMKNEEQAFIAKLGTAQNTRRHLYTNELREKK